MKACAVCLVGITSLLASGEMQAAVSPAPPSLTVSGDWQVEVGAGQVSAGGQTRAVRGPRSFAVAPAGVVSVQAEAYSGLPLFNPSVSGWVKGVRLRGVATQETSAKGFLLPASVSVSATPDGKTPLARDRDYGLDEDWGTLGRLEGGHIAADATVYISYRYSPARLDSLIVQPDGEVVLRQGEERVNGPVPPALGSRELRLANLWIPGRLPKLTPHNLFPVLEQAYPAVPTPLEAVERQLPKTLRKLRSGEPLLILAWGDSVTDGGYLPSLDARWQVQFVQRLRARFPRANIDLVTEAWPGRNTAHYLGEPPGAPHNYAEKVLGARPDLVVSEFVNDAGLSPEQVHERYTRFLQDFRGLGAEWIILTPHYVIPEWMGMEREREVDSDPRPYVAGLRSFAREKDVALADASLRWGRLWRQGTPYSTLLSNRINHPDPRGMQLFADALLDLLPQE